ncbi:sel1 repeat family protein [bacterium]|nr:sel1 repeat family protein [bacterium]MBU1957132.1 sel1 repeat family protein [bacterium]
MKKTLLLLLMVSTVNLTADSNNFYARIQHSNMQTAQYQSSSQAVAKKLFYAKRAAQKGHPKAQFDLAIMYATGQGVQKDERIAFNLFHKAARNNNVEAKYYMGLSFLQGRGVKQQPELARYWFKLATKQGHIKALQHLTQMERSSIHSI